MKTIHAPSAGRGEKIAEYRYAVARREQETVVVIEQTATSRPSITNVIEELATYLVQNEADLTDVPLSSITWYEHYPTRLSKDWLYNYSRVDFDIQQEQGDGLVVWLRGLLHFHPRQKVLANPSWSRPADSEIDRLLQALDANLP